MVTKTTLFSVALCCFFVLGTPSAFSQKCLKLSTQIAESELTQKVRHLYKNRGAYQHYGLPNLSEILIKQIETEVRKLSATERHFLRQNLKEFKISDAVEFASSGKFASVNLTSLQMILYDVVLDHPIGSIIGRHELTHILSLATKSLPRRILGSLAPNTLTRTEETLAFGTQYDFIKDHIPRTDLPNLKLRIKYRSKREIVAIMKQKNLGEGSEENFHFYTGRALKYLGEHPDEAELIGDGFGLVVPFMPKDIVNDIEAEPNKHYLNLFAKRFLDRRLIEDLDDVHSMSRDQYIALKLQDYHIDADIWSYLISPKIVTYSITSYLFINYVMQFLK